MKEHILSQTEEEMLSRMEMFSHSAKDIFNAFNNGDAKFGSVNKGSEEIEITKGNFTKLMEEKNRGLREEVFKVFYKTYDEHKNMIASAYAGNVKKNIFMAKTRKYSTALEKS